MHDASRKSRRQNVVVWMDPTSTRWPIEQLPPTPSDEAEALPKDGIPSMTKILRGDKTIVRISKLIRPLVQLLCSYLILGRQRC